MTDKESQESAIWVSSELDSVLIMAPYMSDEGEQQFFQLTMDVACSFQFAMQILEACGEARIFLTESFGEDSLETTDNEEQEQQA